VLHLADDGTEGRDVTAQDAVLVHAAEFMHHSLLLLEELQEKGPVGRIGAEIVVDEQAAAPQGTQGTGSHALQFRVLL